MSLSRRQERLLERIGGEVCRCDPALASMLAIFARLTSGLDMPGHEQLPAPPLSRCRAALAAAASAAAALTCRVAAGCTRAVRAGAAACAAAAGRLVRWQSAAAPRSPAGSRPCMPPGQQGLSRP
jgi:hypothetical protein